MEKVLNIGDTFTAHEEYDKEFTLHSVVQEMNGDFWAIGLDNQGVPYAIYESDINPIEATVVLNKTTNKKKGKK